jgi:hypothetical protein
MEALGQGSVAAFDLPQGGPLMQAEEPPGLIKIFESHNYLHLLPTFRLTIEKPTFSLYPNGAAIKRPVAFHGAILALLPPALSTSRNLQRPVQNSVVTFIVKNTLTPLGAMIA